MQPVTRFAIVFTVLSTLVLGSARGAPPLDQLPLRDALLARPEVVAELAPEARQRLAQRFEEARKRPLPSAAVLGEPDAQPLDLVRALDLSRLGERKDALVAAQLVLSPVGVEAREFTDEPTEAQGALPPLDGVAAGETAEIEAGALQGTAGVVLSRLLRHSEAKRMVRVQSWPVGAIAIRGTVYVNAAWLVAMSPLFSEPRPRKDAADPTKPKDSTGGGITTKPPGAPADGQSVEAGCGGSVGAPSNGTTAPGSRDRVPESTESTSESGDSDNQTIAASAPDRGPINLPLRTGTEEPGERGGSGFQTLWNGTRTAGAGTGEGKVESLTYALDNGSGAPVDCCRYNSERGCDTTTPCDTPSNSCDSSSGSGCSSGSGSGCSSGSGSGCSSGNGSGCSSGSGSGCSSGNGSGCSSGSGSGCSSGSGSGCSSGSGSGCSSGSGSGCSSGSGSGCSNSSGDSGCSSGSGSSGSGCSSGGSSGSGCSSSGSSGGSCSSGSSGSSCGGSSSGSCGGSSCGSSGSCGKCTAVPVRPSGDIPDPVTLLFLMAPLGFLMLEGRRRRA